MHTASARNQTLLAKFLIRAYRENRSGDGHAIAPTDALNELVLDDLHLAVEIIRLHEVTRASAVCGGYYFE